MFINYEKETLDFHNDFCVNEVKAFLKESDIGFEATEQDLFYVYRYNDEILGTCSLSGCIIKHICVSKTHRDISFTNTMITDILNEANRLGKNHLFIYTKPEYETLFNSIGFSTICKIGDKVLFLENKKNAIKDYINSLKISGDYKNISSIVVNTNPMTKGHKHLIKTASENSDLVYLFLLKEDSSIFPYEVRKEILTKEIKEFENVKLVDGGPYVISKATFPTYFLKEKSEFVKIHTQLDITIFAQYFCDILGITKRYVGSEPYCEVTNTYNETMKEIFEDYNIKLIELERKCEDNQIYYSASLLRKAIKEDNLEMIKYHSCKSTYEFLQSDKAKSIIENIKNSDKRH